MKVCIFTPSNRLVGKLDVSSVDEVAKAVEAFAQGKGDIPNFSYVECGKRVWTITTVSPLKIVEGKVEKDPIVSSKSEPFGWSDFSEATSDFFAAVYVATVVALWGISVCLLGLTVLGWLKTGMWIPTETEWTFKHFPRIEQWINDPRDWTGLAKLLGVISRIPWAFLVAGVFTFAMVLELVGPLMWLVILFGTSIITNM